ncbi:HD domain-containing phosphohydrolase [Limnobacter sp.]|uniref:HD domain-containing phosphohydrolase n=1 Tax=Limnobacter sp. TaxID=2003368 RepID=UPI002590EA56|nr:HD domain-containing phosphohydrolase [Limnobacter sp.]
MQNNAAPVVLILDDEPNVVNAIKRTLRSEAYVVHTSTDPVEALEMVKQLRPIAVLSDMRMPGMDGAHFLAEVQRALPGAARLLLTGYADVQSTIAAINEGHVDRYLTKPWNDDELRLALRQQIDLAQLKQERNELTGKLAAKVNELKVLNDELDKRVLARTQEIHQTTLFLEQAYRELHDQFLNTVKVFSNLLEMTSPLMAGHSRRVAELARALALELKLPEAETQDIYVAGLLHDIGKIGLSERVLATPYAQLDGASRHAMMKHCQKGQIALMALPELHHVAQYVASHHERMDGMGYPDGLIAGDIARGARVLAVAEDVDELQMGLLTGQKMDIQQAIEFVQHGSGKHYDSKVVRALPAALLGLQAIPLGNEVLLDSQRVVPGQVVSRDLYSPEGLLLLAKGGQISSRLVQHLRGLHEREKVTFKVYCEARHTSVNPAVSL